MAKTRFPCKDWAVGLVPDCIISPAQYTPILALSENVIEADFVKFSKFLDTKVARLCIRTSSGLGVGMGIY